MAVALSLIRFSERFSLVSLPRRWKVLVGIANIIVLICVEASRHRDKVTSDRFAEQFFNMSLSWFSVFKLI